MKKINYGMFSYDGMVPINKRLICLKKQNNFCIEQLNLIFVIILLYSKNIKKSDGIKYWKFTNVQL